MSEIKSVEGYQKTCKDLIHIITRHIQIYLSGKTELFSIIREIYYKNYE